MANILNAGDTVQGSGAIDLNQGSDTPFVGPPAPGSTPPGVTKEIWDTLSPQAQNAAAARLSAPAQLTPEEQAAKDTTEKARLASVDQSLGGLIKNWLSPSPTISENGGKLTQLSPGPGGPVKPVQPSASDFPAPKGAGRDPGYGGAGSGAPPPPVQEYVPLTDPQLIKKADQASGQRAQDLLAQGDTGGWIDQQQRAEEAKSHFEAQGRSILNVADEKAAAETRQLQAEHSKKVTALRQEMDDMSDNLSKTKIDPDELYKKMGVMGHIQDAIGGILGGFAQGFNHMKDNPHTEAMKARIARNIQAQKDNYDIQKGRLKDKDSLYAKYMEQTKDEKDALALSQAHAMKIAGNEAENAAHQSDSGIIKANAAKLRADLHQDADKIIENRASEDTKTVGRNPAYDHPAPRGGGGGGGGRPNKKQVDHNQDVADARAELEAATADYQKERGTLGGHFGGAGLAAAHSRLMSARMAYEQKAHDIRPTVAHTKTWEGSIPGPWTPGGDAALRGQVDRLHNEDRIQAQRGNAPVYSPGGGGDLPDPEE